MAWFLSTLALIVAAIILILVLDRCYRKATREVAPVRTGTGGRGW
jgi:flotillin